MSVFNGDSFSTTILEIEFCINSLTGFQEVIEKYVMPISPPFIIPF